MTTPGTSSMGTCPADGPRPLPGVSTTDAASCARMPRRWSTDSAYRSSCVTPRCCTPRTCRAEPPIGSDCAPRLLMWDRAERLQFAVRSDFELHRADSGGTARLIVADL